MYMYKEILFKLADVCQSTMSGCKQPNNGHLHKQLPDKRSECIHIISIINLSVE